ncbi:uncharacterized protein LTR77_002800 [Saxophila tyrrhenica]|uniref:Uncharacterized protein n=1 Tax=Saxophila tyrrhenica TaxID=1690608 RepID=A0AAV9PK27_9PEZI|nr:hypothetical protein LTR77_002800 [Saxophila tyrrhenica]
MDDHNTHDWTANALFSPSKARVQQAQAKDWAAVDAWLAKKYAPAKRPPIFERNEETLQILLTLATLNEGADEQRALVDRVHKAALQALKKGRADREGRGGGAEVLFKQLNSDVVLTTLAKAAVALDAPDVRIDAMGGAVSDLTAEDFAASQQLQRVELQLRALKAQRHKAEEQLRELRSESFHTPDHLVDQTGDWVRSTKQLKAKVGEYDERLASARAAGRPTVKLDDINRQTGELSAQQAHLKDLEMQLRAFQSLPTDAKAARQQLESTRETLRTLTKQRDELFERLYACRCTNGNFPVHNGPMPASQISSPSLPGGANAVS